LAPTLGRVGRIRKRTWSSHDARTSPWSEILHRSDQMSDYTWTWTKSLSRRHGSSLGWCIKASAHRKRDGEWYGSRESERDVIWVSINRE
jgi:uncharacterized protein (DUF2235 family)